MMRGAAKIKIGDLKIAIEDLDSCKALDTTNFKWFFYYGRAYLLSNRPDSALKYYSMALEKNPEYADSYDDRAKAKIELKDFAGGIADEDMAIKINPRNDGYYTNRGYGNLELGKYKDAIADFNRSIAIQPSHKAFANRGYAFYNLKSYQLAISDFTRGLDLYQGDYFLSYYRELAYKKVGERTKACTDFRNCIRLGYLKAQEELKDVCQ